MELRRLFSQFFKKNPNFQKKNVVVFLTHMVTCSFSLMAIVCVIANLLLTKNDIIVRYNKFPNLGVCHPNFPNLKGPRAPFQN